MTEDAHHHKPIVDFKRMYCTVCLFLQWKLFEIRNEKRCDGAFFHMHHKPSEEDPEKGPTTLQKGPQNPPLDPLKTPQGGLRNQSP